MFQHLQKNKVIAPLLMALTINMAIIGNLQAVDNDTPVDSAKTFEQLRVFVDRQMAEKAVPGVAMGVLHNGKFHTAGFGITNVDNPQLVTDNTLFQIGSITKTMTGTIMMRLAEQGKLDLDAPVRAYLPDFKVKDEQVSAQVTVRNLLTHMSGWVCRGFW
jgi:CubicO group peptidase (beta-lactamase class C family)